MKIKCAKCDKDATRMVALQAGAFGAVIVEWEFLCNDHKEEEEKGK
tara:strand:- start:6430 stop:6567 length:138 start_codon:yes stop_codon:yes gene_type:complete